MEGSETASSFQSEESSLLDIPCAITEKSFLVNLSTGRNQDPSNSADMFVSPASTALDTVWTLAQINFMVLAPRCPNAMGAKDPDSVIFEEHTTGPDRNVWSKSCEKMDSSRSVNSANEHLPAWTPEQRKEGESTVKKSLDAFYSTCCPKKIFGGSPALESASRSLSTKIADLANREGTEYALRSLWVAQSVLNRDGNKVFPQRSSGACFSAAAGSTANVEEGKIIPGLSDDVLQFLLKQNVTE